MTLAVLGCSKSSNENSSLPSTEQKNVVETSNVQKLVSDIPINVNIIDVVKKYNLTTLKEKNNFILDKCGISFKEEKGKVKYFSVEITDKKCNFEISQLIYVMSNDVTLGKILEDLTGVNVEFTYECPPPNGCGNSTESNALYMILLGSHARNFETVAFEFNSEEVNEEIYNAYEASEIQKNGGKVSPELQKILSENKYDAGTLDKWKKIHPSKVYFGNLDGLGDK